MNQQPTNNQPPNPLETLPFELLSHIFSYLSHEERTQIALTRHAYNNLIREELRPIRRILKDPVRLRRPAILKLAILRNLCKYDELWRLDEQTRCCFLQEGNRLEEILNQANVDAIVYITNAPVRMICGDFVNLDGVPTLPMIFGYNEIFIQIPKAQSVRSAYMEAKPTHQETVEELHRLFVDVLNLRVCTLRGRCLLKGLPEGELGF